MRANNLALRMASLHRNCLPNTRFTTLPDHLQLKIYESLIVSNDHRVLFIEENGDLVAGAVLALRKSSILVEFSLSEKLSICRSILQHPFIWWSQSLEDLYLNSKFDGISILAIFVDRKNRRSKFGTALVSSIKKIAKNRNLNLYVTTKKSNASAKDFYLRNNFSYKDYFLESILFEYKIID